MELESDLVDAGVEGDHCGQSDPEVADLQDAVEQCILHVLDVALARLHWTVSDEVLPAYDWREENGYWHRPRYRNHTQHLHYTPANRLFKLNRLYS